MICVHGGTDGKISNVDRYTKVLAHLGTTDTTSTSNSITPKKGGQPVMRQEIQIENKKLAEAMNIRWGK